MMQAVRQAITDAFNPLRGVFGTPNNTFYVGAASGTAGATVRRTSSNGKNPVYPVASIAAAIALCVSNNGDTVYCMPGYTESIVAAAGIDLSVAGMTIEGRGNGTNKPTLTVGTATTATLRVNADNCKLKGFRFVGDLDDLAMFINVNANNFTLEDCEFVTSSTKEAISFIQLATTKDYFTCRNCRFEQPTDPGGTDGGAGTGAFYCVDSEYILFENCWFNGNFETAIFHNRTTACKNLWVKNCHGIQALSGAEPFQLVDGANGAMLGGGFITPAEAAATEATLVGTVGASFFVLQPGAFGNDGAAGGQGGIIIATAS